MKSYPGTTDEIGRNRASVGHFVLASELLEIARCWAHGIKVTIV